MRFVAEKVPVDILPKPAGFRLLLAPVVIEDVSKGGIVIPGSAIEVLEYFRNIAKVIAVGDECYKHPKFQGGVDITVRLPTPWCKVGDIVSYSSYTGTELTIIYQGEKHKLKFINDDEVVSVITDTAVLNFT